MNFAVIETGGKQYKVSEGSVVSIEKMKGEYKEGDKISFSNVLLLNNSSGLKIGKPFIKGSEVNATISKIKKDKKVEVIHYKSKSNHFKRYGHRQPKFVVKIDSIK